MAEKEEKWQQLFFRKLRSWPQRSLYIEASLIPVFINQEILKGHTEEIHKVLILILIPPLVQRRDPKRKVVKGARIGYW